MPKGLKILEFSFEDPTLTHYGGLALMERFCQKLHLRRRLQRHVRFVQRASPYMPCDVVLTVLLILVAGLRRVSETPILQYNGTFLGLRGMGSLPVPCSIRRFLRRLSPHSIRQLVRLHDQLRTELAAMPRACSTLTFDLDSVVLPLYGHQAGARVGYNPKKRGRRSYHPLLCFEAHRREFWHGALRPGNASSSTNVVRFMQACLAKVPSNLAHARIRVRADSGFFGNKLLSFLEKWGCGYIMIAQQHPAIRQRAQAVRFRKLANGWAVGEFRYRAKRWKLERRFVVVRRPIPSDPVEAAQLHLFKDQHYAYEVLVTNLELTPWRVWCGYRPRATVEKLIRELVYDLPLGQIATGDWKANVAYFHLLMLAYNLVHWFKRLCLPASYRDATVETVRRDFLAVPARLAHPGHRNVLHLPRDYPLKSEFLAAVHKLDQLKVPGKR
jgi:Transposase DDE domain group 1